MIIHLKFLSTTMQKKKMNELHEIAKNTGQNFIFLLQLQAVYTVGKTSKIKLENTIKIDRGGDITFHNKGQLVIYFVCNLSTFYEQIDISDFISKIEKTTIEALKKIDIKAFSEPTNRGVSVGEKKIASIGICVKQKTTKYGIAINVNNDLSGFQKITPCGMKNCKMTSLKNEKINTTVTEFAKIFISIASHNFN